MIYGDGILADGFHATFGEPPFTWLLYSDYAAQIMDSLRWEPDLKFDKTVVVSTPIYAGTIKALEGLYPTSNWVYVPENVREAHPEDWAAQSFYVIGTRSSYSDWEVEQFLTTEAPSAAFFSVSPETAEMVKPAINGFLAASITYARDIAEIGKGLGADMETVATIMRLDPRIGSKAYVGPDGDISPHLQRELDHLTYLRTSLAQESSLVRNRRRRWFHRDQPAREAEEGGNTLPRH